MCVCIYVCVGIKLSELKSPKMDANMDDIKTDRREIQLSIEWHRQISIESQNDGLREKN